VDPGNTVRLFLARNKPYHQSDSGSAEATGAIHASHALPRTDGLGQ